MAVAAGLTTLVSACNYSHVGPAATTFSQQPPLLGAGSLQTQTGPLVLRVRRHVDTILHGPDNEEDQLLVVEVRNFQFNHKLQIPSDNVTLEFVATRFGPSSKGQGFGGYLVVKKITPREVDAYLHINVMASTASGSYAQTEKFHGDFTFMKSTEEAPRAMNELIVKTNQHTGFVEITSDVQRLVDQSGVKEGVCICFVQHTTAGITINENADPDVVTDMIYALDKAVPWEDAQYRHGEGNTAAHVKSSMMGHAVQVLVRDGKLQFGTWQGIYLCEFDGPRTRKVWVSVTG